ncbi:hypothetical protein C8F01DRAFT_1145697, partial [Mycena amicta]
MEREVEGDLDVVSGHRRNGLNAWDVDSKGRHGIAGRSRDVLRSGFAVVVGVNGLVEVAGGDVGAGHDRAIQEVIRRIRVLRRLERVINRSPAGLVDSGGYKRMRTIVASVKKNALVGSGTVSTALIGAACVPAGLVCAWGLSPPLSGSIV